MSSSDQISTPGGQIADDAALWRRLRGVVGEDFKAAPLYRTKLAGATPGPFALLPKEFRTADPQRGEALAAGHFRFGQERFVMEPDETPWRRAAPSRHFADRLHRFGWLRHMMAIGGAAEARAIGLIDDWCDEFGKFNAFSWRIGPTADRCWNWLCAGARLFGVDESGPSELRRGVFARQIRHLTASLETCPDPIARWRGAVVLVATAFAYDAIDKRLPEALARFETEATAQFLPDGGHVSRNPEQLMRFLFDLVAIEDLFARAGESVPDFIPHWIRRAAPMLSFFIAEDGGLVPLNGGSEALSGDPRAAIDAAQQPPRRFMFAMKSGFQKLTAEKVTIWVDTGPAPEPPFADAAHAGCLAFDLYDRGTRLISSCGGSEKVGPRWQDSVRSSHAHSTLTLADLDIGQWERNEESRLEFPTGPDGVAARRLEEETQDVWLEAQHGGWRERFGLVHKRRLFLSASGDRLVGEDALVRPLSQGEAGDLSPIPFAVRFHIHPSCRAEVAGDSIRIIPEAGQIWRFKTSHANVRLEPSRYIGRGRVERSRQIVLTGRADPSGDGSKPPNCIKWAFIRERAL